MSISKILILWMLVGSSCCVFFAVLFFAILFPLRNDSDPAFRLEWSAEVILSPMNTSIDPCEDFYAFACGSYAQDVNAESDPLETARNMMLKNISNFLEMNSSSSDPFILRKARTFYRSCLLNSSVSTHRNQSLKSVIHVLEQVGLSVIPPLDRVSRNFSYVYTMARAKVIFNMDFFIQPTIQRENSTHVLLSLSKHIDDSLLSGSSEHLVSSFMKNDGTKIESDEDFLERARNIVIIMYGITHKTVPDLTSSKFNSTIAELYLFDMFIERMLTTMLKSDFEYNKKTLEPIKMLHLPNMYMTSQNCSVSNKFNWTMYIATLMEDMPGMRMNDDHIFIWDPSYLSYILNSVLCASNPQTLELYMWWKMVNELAPYSAIFEYEERNLWCASEVNNILPHATALMLMVNRSDMLQTMMEIGNMTNDIRKVFNRTITNATWMSQAHKDKISKKLMDMRICIGYPLWLNDYKKVDKFHKKYSQANLVEGDFLTNILTLKQIRQRIEKLMDWSENSTEWQCTFKSLEVNSEYDSSNELHIQSGYLQFPFYGHVQRALNFGSMGSVIGHELWHGFDDTSMESLNVFEDHNVTKEEYSRRVQCLVNHYSNYSNKPNTSTEEGLASEDPLSRYGCRYSDWVAYSQGEVLPDGLRTLDENLSDVYGLKISFDAYKDLAEKYGSEPSPHGLQKYSQEQLFFIAYASTFCSRYSHSSYSGSTDVHSPNSIRVWGALRNSEDFAKAWGCKRGSWMNPNADKCEIW